MSWTDVHVHLDKLTSSVEETLTQARLSGVHRVITIGTDPSDHQTVVSLVQKFSGTVFGTLGIHPHDATSWSPEVASYIKANASLPGIVAVGEIGLDYYYNQSPKDIQLKAFEEQLQLSIDLGLPVEIHTRDAEEDTVAMLKNFQGKAKGLIHCFTGTQYLADEALDLGFNLSISGVATFKNADSLRKTVATVPRDRIHVETDAPFLAPIPFRGKENTSAFMIHTARVVAEQLGISFEELEAQTEKNLSELFKKIPLQTV